MILAEATPSSVQIAGWLACLAAVATALNQILRFKDRVLGKDDAARQISPQPLEIRHATEFVRKEDHERQHKETTAKIDGLQESVSEQIRLSSIQRRTIYEKIDEVRKENADDLAETRRELTAKIDNMPAQIVTGLVNTKHLWGGGK